MGYINKIAPKELRNEVQVVIDEFNKNIKNYSTHIEEDVCFDDTLPF